MWSGPIPLMSVEFTIAITRPNGQYMLWTYIQGVPIKMYQSLTATVSYWYILMGTPWS